MSVLDVLRSKEDEIRLDRFESEFAIDQNGDVVLDKRGEASEITFTDEEIAALRAASGVRFTHNHPAGWKYAPDDPRHGGNSFSPHDIHLACKTELVEIRVVTPLYRFSMQPPGGGWNEAYWNNTLEPIFQAVFEQVKEELARDALRGRITPQAYLASQYHETWRRVANMLGLRYTRVEE